MIFAPPRTLIFTHWFNLMCLALESDGGVGRIANWGRMWYGEQSVLLGFLFELRHLMWKKVRMQ